MAKETYEFLVKYQLGDFEIEIETTDPEREARYIAEGGWVGELKKGSPENNGYERMLIPAHMILGVMWRKM